MAGAERFLDGRVTLHCGDMRDVLAALPENSFDSAVTDPPYHLLSIVKRFGPANSAPVRVGDINASNDLKAAYARQSAGFMGKAWDGGDIAFDAATWAAVLRVLKPGAHACVFCIPKHIGFVQVAMQQAGFEFRDVVVWAFGSGFPKSHDVSKGIDKAAGAERKVVGERELWGSAATGGRAGQYANSEAPKADGSRKPLALTAPATDAAREWEGWGTALKPAVELIVLARKPLSEGTVAANVLRWGCGALNIDKCRVSADDGRPLRDARNYRSLSSNGIYGDGLNGSRAIGETTQGRWPANLILSVPEDEYELRPFATSEEKRELFRWLSENA